MLLTLGIGALGACSSEKEEAKKLQYFRLLQSVIRLRRKILAVSDDYHGTVVADPYRLAGI